MPMNIKKLISKQIGVYPRIFYKYCTIRLKLYGRYISRIVRRKYKNEKENDMPTTLQLPITYKCNFDCVMCGMRHLVKRDGFSPEELGKILQDKLFKKITSVGINGGEPFILNNICSYIETVITNLPSLTDIFIISNGYFTDNICRFSPQILEMCHARNIKFHLSISIDGYGEMQDTMRGHVNAFDHVKNTCNQILKHKSEFCDSLQAICTITKVNVYSLVQLDSWAKSISLPISYNVATLHKRIDNKEKYEDFSILTDERARMLAEDFFYGKFMETNNETYYCLFYYAHTGNRISDCGHRTQTVTLTPDGGISYCATFSDEIGNAFNRSAYDIFFDQKNIAYRNKLHEYYCKGCSHYTRQVSKDDYFLNYAAYLIKPYKFIFEKFQ